MRTVAVILTYCLNIGVDPPDVVKTDPCARMECWIGTYVRMCVWCCVMWLLACMCVYTSTNSALQYVRPFKASMNVRIRTMTHCICVESNLMCFSVKCDSVQYECVVCDSVLCDNVQYDSVVCDNVQYDSVVCDGAFIDKP